MRIGLISFEYPPDTAVGGIATYTKQWATVLQDRGHDVEVFAASPIREGSFIEDGIFINLIKTGDRISFKKNVLPVFTARNLYKKFEIVESPEFNADAKEIKQKFHSLILVVKLHTPSFLINELNEDLIKVSNITKLRVKIGAWRRFRKPSCFWLKDSIIEKEEKEYTNSADIITSPSIDLITIVGKRFNIAVSRIKHLPNPYVPTNELLEMTIPANSKVIAFIGRLEKRKGIKIFTEVIPIILEKYPEYKFLFVGKDTFILPEGISARETLSQELKKYLKNIKFIENVLLEEIPSVLKTIEICVFPSIWENFPTVCLEAMSAGRAIVGSRQGGMSDMLMMPKAGILINPLDKTEIAEAICQFIESKELRYELGLQARKSVCEKYNSEVIGAEFEKLISQVKK